MLADQLLDDLRQVEQCSDGTVTNLQTSNKALKAEAQYLTQERTAILDKLHANQAESESLKQKFSTLLD